MTKNNIIVEKQNRKYKNGSVSMVAVLFRTTVMSLICISFIKAITSGQNQNNMYTQSQGAYDASITGINDTQLAISECLNSPNINQTSDKYKACQLLLYGKSFSTTETFSDCKKTILAVEYLLFGKPINPSTPEEVEKVGVIDEESNQSYNCITITPNNNSYQGILRSGNEDGVVIPIIKDAEYVRVSYGASNFSVSEIGVEAGSPCNNIGYGYDVNLINRANNLCMGKSLSPYDSYGNTYDGGNIKFREMLHQQ